MEIHVKKSTLQAELSRVQSVVEKKTALPILECVLMRVEAGNKIVIAASDTQTTMQVECLAEQVDEQGAICIPARRIFDIVRSLPEGILTITKESNSFVRVKSGGSNFRIPAFETDSFPLMPEVSGDVEWITIPAKQLKAMLMGVAFSASPNEDSNYSIKGCKVELSGSEIKTIATDAKRLSVATGETQTLLLSDEEFLIPIRGVNEIIRMTGELAGDVSLVQHDNHVFVKSATCRIACRQMVGEFVNYQHVLDAAQCETFATFKIDALTDSIKRAKLASDSEYNRIALEFTEGKLTISAKTAENGEAEDTIESDFTGEDTRIPCNANYLLDFLTPLGSTSVKFAAKNGKSPILMTCGKDGISYVCVTMPLADNK